MCPTCIVVEEVGGGERDSFGDVLELPLVIRGGGGGIRLAGEFLAAGSTPTKAEPLEGIPLPGPTRIA